MSDNSAAIQGALECAERGWPVYPVEIGHDESKCDGGTANCKTSDFKGSWKNSTTDPDKIRKWTSNAYLIDCGAAGLVIADQDPGDSWPFDETMVVESGRGFHHYYEDVLGLPNAQGLQPWGVDVRGDGGLIYGPGSYHPHGGYRRANDLPPALPPAELVQALQRRSKAAEKVEAGKADGKRYAKLSEDERAAVDEAIDAKIVYWRDWFKQALDWPEGHHPYSNGAGETGGWELLTRDAAWSVACMVASPWSPIEDGEALYESIVPEEIRDASRCEGKYGPPLVKKARTEADLSFASVTVGKRTDPSEFFDPLADAAAGSQSWCEWNDCGQVTVNGRHCQLHADNWAAYLEAQQPESKRAAAVEKALERLRVSAEARRLFAAEQRGPRAEPIPPTTLADMLAEPEEETPWLVDGVWPLEGRVVLAAQHKAGKTTVVGNLTRCLVDGGQFLDRFEATPVGRVVLIDNEMPRHKVRQWLREQGIENTSAVGVVSLRGSVSSFDLTDPEVRSQWAETIGPADVLVFDCLRPVLDALGMSEDKDAGRFLTLLSEMCGEAGIDSLLVVHHMGHNGERARGDSAILGWPDANWKLAKEDPEKDDSDRFFSAYGRDVDVSEGRLSYDGESRRLSWAGGSRAAGKASRKQAVADFRDAELQDAVLDVFREARGRGLSKNAVAGQIEAHKGRVLYAIDALGEEGKLELRGKVWFLADGS